MSLVYIEPGRVTQWDNKLKTKPMGHVLGLVKVTTSTFLCFTKVRLHTETKHGNGSNINMSLSIHNTSFKTVHHCIVQR